MTPIDRESLKAWYRDAMHGRVRELEELRPGLVAGDPDAVEGARRIGHALRGSGGSFGFPEVSGVGALLEDARTDDLLRRLEGVTALLRRVARSEGTETAHGWLGRAVGLGNEWAPFPDPEEAWAAAANALDVSLEEVAERVARYFGIEPARTLTPSPAALRLVPEVLLREHLVLPLAEDGVRITVATADPVDLEAEDALQRVTGRRPDFRVAAPGPLRAAVGAVVGKRVARETSPPRGKDQPRATTILVVDDDATSRLIARTVLERAGHVVIEARDGEEGLQILDRAPGELGLVVVDLEMPGLDGAELVRRVRGGETSAHLPIVVLTGAADPEVEAELIDAGADDYIHKPFDPRLFLARVASTLRRALG